MLLPVFMCAFPNIGHVFALDNTTNLMHYDICEYTVGTGATKTSQYCDVQSVLNDIKFCS